MKKAKTTKITTMAQKDSYGNTSFVIELDNGDRGFYTSKDENQTKFVVGKETEYNIEEKQGKKGPYFKITLPQAEQPAWSGKGKPQVDPRVQMISFSASYAKDIICAGKAELKDFGTIFEMIYGEMTSKL